MLIQSAMLLVRWILQIASTNHQSGQSVILAISRVFEPRWIKDLSIPFYSKRLSRQSFDAPSNTNLSRNQYT